MVGIFRKTGRGRELPLKEVIQALGELDLVNVMIEAGPRLVSAALAAGVVDKVVLFYSPRFLGGDALSVLPAGPGRKTSGRARRSGKSLWRVPELREVTLSRFGQDFSVEGYLHDVYRDR